MENDFDAIDQAQAARFKRLLEERKINQAKLAREAGVSHLTDIKKGDRPINRKVIKAILERKDLGYKAVNWILLGSFEEDVFAPVNSKNIPLRSENNPPGSNNSGPHVREPSPIFKKAVKELFSLIENPEMASKLAQGLVDILKKDPERFYNKFYSGIIGDSDMLERIKEN